MARKLQEEARPKCGVLPDSGEEIRRMRDERTECLAERHDAAEPHSR
jgi:hypothetical protein